MIPYEYVDRRGEREVTDWKLDRRQRRALNRKLDLLRRVDWDLAVGSILFKVDMPEVYKVKVTGNVQLRPRVCLGPHDPEEITFLQRVEKKGGAERPRDASRRAARKRKTVIDDLTRRQAIEEED